MVRMSAASCAGTAIGRRFAGSARGVADYLEAEPLLVRVLYIVLTVASGGFGLVVYPLARALIPATDLSATSYGSRPWRARFSAWREAVGLVLVVGVALLILRRAGLWLNSRPATITSLIGLELVASPLFVKASSLGSLRRVLLDSSVLHLAPTSAHGEPVVPESLLVARLVMGLWILVSAGLGAWRTSTMDA
jgi:phage shock protein PspC (stress-responsive transcriptional regulator)